MPRKQRFKPSRKPKPMPLPQTDDAMQVDQSTAQRDDMSGAPELQTSRPPPEARVEENEAR